MQSFCGIRYVTINLINGHLLFTSVMFYSEFNSVTKNLMGKGRYFHSFMLMISLFLCLFLQNSEAWGQKADYPALIPLPQHVDWFRQDFVSSNKLVVYTDLDKNHIVVRQLLSLFPESVVKPINNKRKRSEKAIFLNKAVAESPASADKERYQLTVNSGSIILTAFADEGLFRGLQTLRQLMSERNDKISFKGCNIVDWPAFSIRGFMQDVGRNYMSMPMLKEQIDVLAAYKFNVFHLHLTENQGWRLESKKYPELNAPETMSRWPGKYYTQNEFVELVDYCQERYITLIPEFDIPGHSEAFRKAFSIDSMSDARVQPILLDLLDELCLLVSEEKMPYIHLGTDEVWHSYERPAPGFLEALKEQVDMHGREMIVWQPGQKIENDSTSITQLWSSNGYPKPGHRYLDSRLNYLNHLDPLAGMWQLYFDRICGTSQGDSLKLGGILCCWNDNNVSQERDILRMNPVYPGMLVYSESAWKGQNTDYGDQYLAMLPSPGSKAYDDFQYLEERLCLHRDLYFEGKPFPYVKNSNIPWILIGPFDHQGDISRQFPFEDSVKEKYQINGQTFEWWGPVQGGTVFPQHFFGYPAPVKEKQGTIYALTYVFSPISQVIGCWIGFQGWSRSGGRRGGPFPEQGQWHTTQPKVWVNDVAVEPPIWEQPGLSEKTEEIPFIDEDYFYRTPTQIKLNHGWNKILLKVPQGGNSWKWMFTFVPVSVKGNQVSEVPGLIFSTRLPQ